MPEVTEAPLVGGERTRIAQLKREIHFFDLSIQVLTQASILFNADTRARF
jgi:adenylyl- and sulfurtransferase ThiI